MMSSGAQEGNSYAAAAAAAASSSSSDSPSSSSLSRPSILPYKVVECSSYSAGYRAELIQEDYPTDQASRWSSATNDQNQYLILKLEKPALLATISFGKFHKNHVCNLREFKIFIKTEEAGAWLEVLHSGLRNDNEPECFPLVYPRWSGQDSSDFSLVPVAYVKVQPLVAWGNSFNFSIWYVELRGTMDTNIVTALSKAYQEHIQRESWRICLKFLREQPEAVNEYASLHGKFNVKLEDVLTSQLHELIVTRGEFTEAESILNNTHQQQVELFTEYLEEMVQYRPHWTRLDQTMINANGNAAPTPTVRMPIVRGGHQMCFDAASKSIYLLGGWDGHRDIGDFWRYNIETATWICLSDDTRKEGGPGPRSCHKIVIHSRLRRLYVLGRYIDTESRSNGTAFYSDFYFYDLEKHTWTCIGNDLQTKNGPGLIYDHQMAVDEERDMIYVFGGRVIGNQMATSPGSVPEASYSGFYSYSIPNDQWKLLRNDIEPLVGTPNIKSRIGHSMVFNPKTRQICIYAGQRHKDYLCDFYIYDVDTDTIVEMIKDTSRIGGPDAGFTQRSTLDTSKQELFLFSGLMREKTGSAVAFSSTSNQPTGSGGGGGGNGQASSTQPTEMAKNSFWLYNLGKRRWTRIYSNDILNEDEPCPRFAHQLVYDSTSGLHYLFGGNPGEAGNPRKRLCDFWQLKLIRPLNEQDILRRAIFMLRKQQFYELCLTRNSPLSTNGNLFTPTPTTATQTGASSTVVASSGMLNAMRFLQTKVALSVNHENVDESREFRELSAWLLQIPGDGDHQERIRDSRIRLFNQLIEMLPATMRPPTTSITNLVI